MPPLARQFDVGHLAAFDDIALRTFLDPRDGGVDPSLLGRALQKADVQLVARIADAIPPDAAGELRRAHAQAISESEQLRAERAVVGRLFWALVYWHEPEDYDALTTGERLSARLLEAIELDGRAVCDIGAGTGRFTLAAAARARHVIAIDAVPQLLRILRARVRAAGITNVEVHRGGFRALPLREHSVDVAVACSSFTTSGAHGGLLALAEAERIVRPGGDVVVIWPQDPQWFRARGFHYIAVHSDDAVHFADVATAERLCSRYYAAGAASWVRAHQSSDVPYSVLGVTPPSDMCVKRIE